MRAWLAIGLTFGVLVASLALSSMIQFPLLYLVVPATAWWAAWDASLLRRRYTSDPSFVPDPDALARLQTARPIVVFAACLVVWFFGLPWYLVMRSRLIAGAPTPKRANRQCGGWQDEVSEHSSGNQRPS